MSVPVHIDGSLGEGGGQILRTSLALAALLRQPVKIEKIRANRRQPGLKTQHLAGVLALADITDAEIEGVHKHSTDLVFMPRTIKGGKYRFEISTAGASCMLFSAILPPLLFALQPSEITITGGTHVPFSPPFHYLARVFLPALRKMGAEVELELMRWGFYPKGGGEIRAHVKPCSKLRNIEQQRRGSLQELKLSAYSANLPDHIVQREIRSGGECLTEFSKYLSLHSAQCNALSPGNFVFLEADYEHVTAGFSSLGKRGKPAEEVADEVCQDFRDFDMTMATMDSHLADQLILFMALAQGESLFVAEKTTGHLTTNIDIIRMFLAADIDVERTTGKARVTGVGLTSRH